MKLTNVIQAWGNPDIKNVLKDEIQLLDPELLPLQQGLSQSSYVSDKPFNVIIFKVLDTDETIRVKAGVFYTGIIAGCSCADDPTPQDEQNEYCEVQLDINKDTADTTVTLLS